MNLTKAQLIKIIKEEIMAETSPTFGLRTGDMVRHKDEPDRGVGRVVAKGSARDNFVLVLWADGSQQRHDPSALNKEKVRAETQSAVKEAYVPEIARIELSTGLVAAKWTADGLAMRLLTSNGEPIALRDQKDAKALIAFIEELLAGPMRTSG
jgi:hypothetical protein